MGRFEAVGSNKDIRRLATDEARGSVSAGLGQFQRFQISTALSYRQRMSKNAGIACSKIESAVVVSHPSATRWIQAISRSGDPATFPRNAIQSASSHEPP